MNWQDKPIVFAFWKDEELLGYRADTFNTITDKYPKIYHYSRSQVDTVLMNVKHGCNRIGERLMRKLSDRNAEAISAGVDADPLEMDSVIEHISEVEKTMRGWGEFEVRVHPLPCSMDEFYEMGDGDEWKRKKILTEPEPAIEVHKFKILQNEN